MILEHQRVLVYRAGAIPYIIEDGQIQMLFMRPSDSEFGGFTYQLCKGKVEEGDKSHLDAALRETKEEAGLFIGNVIRTDEVGVFMGRTTVFITKVKSKEMFGEPSFETESVKWMTPEQFQFEGRSLHVPVVQACVRKIKQLEGMD
jgi:8-oxo-dGTP pyrophosphatase MutT (NUDIX family)